MTERIMKLTLGAATTRARYPKDSLVARSLWMSACSHSQDPEPTSVVLEAYSNEDKQPIIRPPANVALGSEHPVNHLGSFSEQCRLLIDQRSSNPAVGTQHVAEANHDELRR